MTIRRLLSAVFASALLISPTFAETAATGGALAPGKPAGVQKAELGTTTLWAIGFLAVVGLGVGLVVSNEGAQVSSATGTAP
jgi:hypothetical protein